NIVGVVLGCNNYQIIDLGVMTPAEKILETARREKVDIIGLSGLITPSLDEMVHVAKEMERNGFDLPLLIGGATTSKKHTAVKIAPVYHHATIHVLDASRSVSVVSKLLNDEQKASLTKTISKEYQKIRVEHEQRYQEKKLLPISQARENRFRTDWSQTKIVKPTFLGTKLFIDYPLEEIRTRIDWTPFFWAWEIRGKFPKLFDKPKVGVEAKKLYDDAQKLLNRIITENSIRAQGVIGFFPANSVGYDDIEFYPDESRTRPIAVIHTIRQQMHKTNQQSNLALADFVAPSESKMLDYIGIFAVTAGIGLEKLVKKFEQDHDDYQSIMAKALADRLAEAFAELMHERVRKEFWGYARDEKLSNQDLIEEKYRGIRPAPGYPACPDHTEKQTLFDVLEVSRKTGMRLTENFAMYPAATVSGYYFAHPESHYFGTGKIGKDQVMDYARRKGMDVKTAEKWLSPILGYDV
ncbi:MAG: vitamin B12 dependent-methionine synthase activation domain-containing protein, partial [Anaerolineales bacterium]